MGSEAVRAAMVKASVGNVKTCLMLDEDSGAHWTSAPAADVHNVVDELARLQAVEARIKARIEDLGVRRDRALEQMRKCRDSYRMSDRSLTWERKASGYLDRIYELEEMLSGS